MSSGDGDMRTLSPIELTFYNAATSLCIMGTWAVVSEGTRPFNRLGLQTFELDVLRALMLTVVTACVIQLSGASVIQAIGAVAAQLTGGIKGSLSVLGAWAALGEVITPQQWVGYMIVITSIAVYNR